MSSAGRLSTSPTGAQSSTAWDARQPNTRCLAAKMQGVADIHIFAQLDANATYFMLIQPESPHAGYRSYAEEESFKRQHHWTQAQLHIESCERNKYIVPGQSSGRPSADIHAHFTMFPGAVFAAVFAIVGAANSKRRTSTTSPAYTTIGGK